MTPNPFPIRYILIGLTSIALSIIYGLKVNLSVAIVAMVNNTAVLLEHRSANKLSVSLYNDTIPTFACQSLQNGPGKDVLQDGPFSWSESTQGLVLGSYFWGYILTLLPGGRLAEVYSAKWVIWVSVVTNVVTTLLIPIAANLSYIALVVVRFIEGLGSGLCLPAVIVILSRWVLAVERNASVNFALSGMPIGALISLLLSGVLADSLGWQFVFYVQGGLSIIWCVLWIFLVFDKPENHPRITFHELELFERSDQADDDAHEQWNNIPWRAILCSGPFWAIVIAHLCSNFGWYMVLVELPTYFKQILGFKITKNSTLSALPYLTMYLFGLFWSTLIDWMKRKRWISNTRAIRILSTTIASVFPAMICFVGVSLAGCDRDASATLMIVGVGFLGAKYSGFLSNHMDIAPNYAGTLLGLTDTVASTAGFIVPAVVGELTEGNQTLERWQAIFYVTAGILFVECIAYFFLASGEVQPWNDKFPKDEDQVINSRKEVGAATPSSPATNT